MGSHGRSLARAGLGECRRNPGRRLHELRGLAGVAANSKASDLTRCAKSSTSKTWRIAIFLRYPSLPWQEKNAARDRRAAFMAEDRLSSPDTVVLRGGIRPRKR